MDRETHLGMGVMLGLLGGRNAESDDIFRAAVGKTIVALSLGDDNALHFTFMDNSQMKLFDDGQSCCESRYMRTDDDLARHIGAQLLSAEVREAPNAPEEYGAHEVEFLLVTTSHGVLTMASHNEHNGYYGGFLIRAADDA